MNETKQPAVGPRLDAPVRPAAWAVVAFGRVQKLVVSDEVADEVACKWREQDPRADALPLYGQDALLQARAAIYSAEQAQIEAPLRAEIARLREVLAVVVRDWTEQFERNGHHAPGWVRQAREVLGPNA